MALTLLVCILISSVSFIITLVILPRQIKFMSSRKWVGYDIHKASRPAVAESGGISMLIGMVAGLSLLMVLVPESAVTAAIIMVSVLLASAIGILDDKLRLSSLKKIISTLVATIPMTVLYMTTSLIKGDPPVPFLGQLQVTLLYIPFIPGFLAVMMNSVNMLEGYNGEGSGTSIVVSIALLAGAIITGSLETIFFILPIIAAIIAFFIFNRYPAKVFPGDIGTLQIGMALGCVAIAGSLEFVLIISIIPHILNAFHVIRSVRGFKESGTIKVKDIELMEGDLIKASREKDAPLSLPRIIVAKKPLSEPSLVKNIIMIVVVSSSLAVYSSYLTWMTINDELNLILGVILLVITLGGCALIYFLFPAIRGLIVIIISVFLTILGLLVLIDLYVVGIEDLNWLVAGAIGGSGLIAWYILSMKYFSHITTRRP
ncbi:MAG: hypothetical protein ACTSUE_19505 [Promethearchaeota archaeon]